MSNPLNLSINRQLCFRCGVCRQECAFNVLGSDEEGVPTVLEGGEDRCVRCQHCVLACPRGALSILGVEPAVCEDSGGKPSYEQVLQLIKNRRSIRHFQKFGVEPQTIDELMDAMKYVPTGRNDHRLNFSVLSGKGMREFVKGFYAALKEVVETKQVPEEQIDRIQSLVDAYAKNLDPVFRKTPHMLFVSEPEDAPCTDVDPAIALSYFELLANAKGIGTCWCGMATYLLRDAIPALYPFIVPPGYKPGYAMLFGYPQSEFFRLPRPLPVRVEKV